MEKCRACGQKILIQDRKIKEVSLDDVRIIKEVLGNPSSYRDPELFNILRDSLSLKLRLTRSQIGAVLVHLRYDRGKYKKLLDSQ